MDAAERRMKPNRVNSTLHFSSIDWATIADGTGWMYLLHTGDRSHSSNDWKVNFSFTSLFICLPVDSNSINYLHFH